MYAVKTKKIVLTEDWLGWPAGHEMTIVAAKADEMIGRGVAKSAAAKTKRARAPKNRAVRTDGTPVDNTG